MFNSRLFGIVLGLVMLASACGPAQLVPPDPQPLPSPAASWTINLMQSGGFAGVALTIQVTSDGRLTAEDQRAGRSVSVDLPPETVAKLAQLYSESLAATAQPKQTGCADCFIYDLELRSGGRIVSVHADDTNLNDSGATELIRMLQQLRDNALKGQP